ncbi:hypothetical protein [Microcoleus sp. PH2017_27_LUM_O_A]|nr:hypothetical protein [Microcoleus sp. PH2017_27_LUM_O_A]
MPDSANVRICARKRLYLQKRDRAYMRDRLPITHYPLPISGHTSSV